MNDRQLAHIGTPEGFFLAPGCYRATPRVDEDSDLFWSRKPVGFADWMAWADAPEDEPCSLSQS